MKVNEIQDLVNRIKNNAQAYYIDAHPLISDAEFDKLIELLRNLDPNHPILNTVGWGCEPVSDTLKKESHIYPVEKFDTKIKKANELTINPDNRVYTVKLDGGSVLCYYRDGELYMALTRGNGEYGFDVTNKLNALAPMKVANNFTGVVRGELIMPCQEFEHYKAEGYASSRNLAIGMLRRNSLSVNDLTSLRFVAYKAVGTMEGNVFSTKLEVLQWLTDNHFTVVDTMTFDNKVPTDDELRDAIKSYSKYEIDGIIVTDNTYVPNDKGATVQMDEQAYKTASDIVDVTVTKLDWTMSRTFRLKPRVFFSPVELSGALVVKATGFNAKFIKDNCIGKGAQITVSRSGEVIPNIESVVVPADSPDLPTTCPVCHAPLHWKGVELVCNNPNCASRNRSDLIRWIEVLAMTKGLGMSTIMNILDSEGVDTIAKLYSHKYDFDELLSIDGVGMNTVKLFMQTVEKLHQPVPVGKFLLACNLESVGYKGANQLAEHIDLILNPVMPDESWEPMIMNLKASNKTGKKSLIDSICQVTENAELITFQDDTTDELVESPPIEQKGLIAITGKLSTSRNEFMKYANNNGWTEGNIKKADILVTNKPESTSGKAKTARQLQSEGSTIKIMSEDEFRKLNQ